jgi:methyl-accepting chemotaxis protein
VEEASLRVKEQSDKVNSTAAHDRQELGKMIENLGVATAAMNEVAKLAQRSNQVAEQATTTTATALNTVNKTVTGMDSIRQTIAEAEKRIKRLGERSQEISGIVNLINTISERTHVLALNASMQAAVAGEAGRGFAVVAEEVQRLAESSRNATSQIATLVSNIQIETNETIATVNRTIAQVVDGSQLAQESGEQMRATQETTNNLVELVKRIASSSQVQMKIAHELKTRVDEISAGTVRTAEQLKSQSEVTDTLLNYSERLVESVSVFKLPEQDVDPSMTGDMARPNRRAA